MVCHGQVSIIACNNYALEAEDLNVQL